MVRKKKAEEKKIYTSFHDIPPREYMYFPKGTIEVSKPGSFSRTEINHLFISMFVLTFAFACKQEVKENKIWIISAPCGSRITKIDKHGKTVIPNGRYISPVGTSIVTAPHPYGLTISSDNSIAVTANSGVKPLSITIIRNLLSENPEVQQIPPGPSTDKGVLASVFMGLAISPDNKTVYVAGGQENLIYLLSQKCLHSLLELK